MTDVTDDHEDFGSHLDGLHGLNDVGRHRAADPPEEPALTR